MSLYTTFDNFSTYEGLYFCYGDTSGDSISNMIRWPFIDTLIHIDTIVGMDTTWDTLYTTHADPFDGGQHYFEFSWDVNRKHFRLSIDGRYMRSDRYISDIIMPVYWENDNLVFGENTDGYLERLEILSRTAVPEKIVLDEINISDNKGYLPPIQPDFNDTVDCIVISPDGPLFREELDRYALRNISMGIRTKVVTLSEIGNYYSGSDMQDKIRNFLKRAYLEWDPEYLILGASTLHIPDREVDFQNREGRGVTTDWYYACLEENWNEDGDGYFAENEDNPDLTPELIVGRFPANNWQELRTMINKSTMAFGLSPYSGETVETMDSAVISGIRMFGDIGSVSDGKDYGIKLENLIKNGQYSSDMGVKSYYPSDDFERDTSGIDDSMAVHKQTFIDTMTPFPSLWVHYGHGYHNTIWVDRVGKGGNKTISLKTNDIKEEYKGTFNSFKNMGHVRVLGCLTASQRQYSFGRNFLAKPYGGALTYLGTNEYSYPAVENKIISEELKAFADSSLFRWGDIFRYSSGNILGSQGGWDLTKWVVFARNYLGDPLLPVRYRNILSEDTLEIDYSGSITNGYNEIAVTVKQDGLPVEGALVGVTKKDVDIGSYSFSKDMSNPLPFGHCVTNRYGKGVLLFNANKGDSIVFTATHHDYLPGRTINHTGFSDSVEVISFLDELSDYDKTGESDGVLAAGDSVYYEVRVRAVIDDSLYFNVDSIMTYFDTTGTGIIITDEYSNETSIRYGLKETGYFILGKCHAGAQNMKMISYFYYGSSLVDSLVNTVPVVGSEIVPVITYNVGDDGDVYPESGDNVQMTIIFKNKYPAAAYGVGCELVYDDIYLSISNAETGTFNIYPDSQAVDTSIRYSLSGGYSYNTAGILDAKLVITGDNIYTDTIGIDLNPLYNVDGFEVYSEQKQLDYKNGVKISWKPMKNIEGWGIQSDFMGYVVLRDDTTDDKGSELLTPWPVSGCNFYYDILEGPGKYKYTVNVVDSSYNMSTSDSIFIEDPSNIKPGFPLLAEAPSVIQPFVSDHNKDGKGEINRPHGQTHSTRSDGQESGWYDGSIWGNSQYIQYDLNRDGFNEAVMCNAVDGKIRRIHRNDSDEENDWSFDAANDGNHAGTSLHWYRSPIIADIDGNDTMEIIAYGMDNAPEDSSCYSTTLYVLKYDSTLLARYVFADKSYAPAIAVGDFIQGNGDTLEIIAGAKMHSDSGDNAQWKLFCLSGINSASSTFNNVSSIDVCNEDTTGTAINSGISVGNIFSGDDKLEIVLSTGSIEGETMGKDTLRVFQIDRTTGNFTTMAGYYPVTFSRPTRYAAVPALGSLDTIDDKDDIVFATDDTLYILRMNSDTGGILEPVVPPKRFGLERAHRLFSDELMPQPLLADIDNDDQTDVVVNHWGDGSIWAFGVDAQEAKVKNNFPLKTEGKVEYSCEITDLESDGILDLVAMDGGGYLFAWELDTGTITSQPWPSKYGNSWNTAYTGYGAPNTSGYLYERWAGERTAPFKWIETGANNTTAPSGDSVFYMQDNMLVTDTSGSYNLHFTGPNTESWKNYQVIGKFRFDSSDAEFGINFYSKFPQESEKYVMMRESDSTVKVYYYSDSSTSIQIGDAIKENASNDFKAFPGIWYNYLIKIQTIDDINNINVLLWEDTESKPDVITSMYNENHNNGDTAVCGRTGITNHSGSGKIYISPLQVISNDYPGGSEIASDNFIADTIVDIKPYTPVNFHPDYSDYISGIGQDNTGFVLDTTNSAPSLVYYDKEGVDYPVMCRWIPETNLSWDNYIYTGQVIKPAGSQYDEVEVHVPFYCQDRDNYYDVVFREDSIYFERIIEGEIDSSESIVENLFTNGNTLTFEITIDNEKDAAVEDSIITISARYSINSGSWIDIFPEKYDYSNKRIKSGVPGIGLSNLPAEYAEPIRFRNFNVKKTE